MARARSWAGSGGETQTAAGQIYRSKQVIEYSHGPVTVPNTDGAAWTMAWLHRLFQR